MSGVPTAPARGDGPLRVLLTVHKFFPREHGGTEVLTRDTALELARRGHDVTVLTTDPRTSASSPTVEHLDYDFEGIRVHSLRLPVARTARERLLNEYANPAVAEHVRDFARALEPDVVHMFHLGRLSGAVIETFRGLGVPLVFTATDFWSICVMSTLQKPSGELSDGPGEPSANCLRCRQAERWFRDEAEGDGSLPESYYDELAERAASPEPEEDPRLGWVRVALERTPYLRERINAVDAILAPTKLTAGILAANGIDEDRMRLSPYGIDARPFRGVRAAREPSAELRLGYIGTIVPSKGLEVLLDAFERLGADRSVSLRVCGCLDTKPSFGRRVYARGAPDPRINFAGEFPNREMADELSRIDVLVVPSTWHENAPLVLYSALAAGAPVVASRVGGMSDIIRHGENGLLFEPGDARDLAAQLERLLGEPGLTDELRDGTDELRTVADSVDEMLALYEELRARRQGHPGSPAPLGAHSA